MKALTEYYEENICTFCLNKNTDKCKKVITNSIVNNTETLICYDYLLNDNVEKPQYDIKDVGSTLPTKYYFKNYREI